MTWGAVAVGGATLLSGALSSRSSKKSAKAQQQASQQAIEEQRRVQNQNQANIEPYLGIGNQALGQLQGLIANPASFASDPAYQFLQQQGLQALDRSAAARGRLYSGGADADRIRFGQGLASQEYGNQFSRLYNLASLGQNAAAGAASQAQTTASNIGNLYGNQGQARADQAINQANIYSGALQNLGTAFGQYLGNRPQQQPKQTTSIYSFGNNVGNFGGY